MANSRSARKRIRSNERKRVRNRAVRAAVRTTVGKARRALLGDVEAGDAASQVKQAIRVLDRAAEKGIIHANNARRRKSRLASMAAELTRAGTGAAGEKEAARSVAAGGAKGRAARTPASRKPAAKSGAAGKAAAKPAGQSAAATSQRSSRSARPPREQAKPAED